MGNYEDKLFEMSDIDEGKRRDLFHEFDSPSCDICSGNLNQYTFAIDGAVQETME